MTIIHPGVIETEMTAEVIAAASSELLSSLSTLTKASDEVDEQSAVLAVAPPVVVEPDPLQPTIVMLVQQHSVIRRI